MALKLSLGIPLRNHRWRLNWRNSVSGLADQWRDGYTNLTPTHSIDPLGFGKQKLTASAPIAASTSEYTYCYTPKLSATPSSVKLGLTWISDTNDAGIFIHYKLISHPSGTSLLIGDNVEPKATGIGRFTAVSNDSAGVATDTYYEIRLGAYTLDNTYWLEFSRSLCLFYTWEIDAYQYTLTADTNYIGELDDTVFCFADHVRAPDGHQGIQDGTGGATKIRRAIPIEYVFAADSEVLQKLYYRNRPTLENGGRVPLVLEDSSIRGPAQAGNPTIHYNPGYFNWVDPEYPLNRLTPEAGDWYPDDPPYGGVMHFEEI